MFRVLSISVSAFLIVAPLTAQSSIDRSASVQLQSLSDTCSGILADAVANTEANKGQAIKGDAKAATQELRSELSDCASVYLDAVDGVLDKFVAASSK